KLRTFQGETAWQKAGGVLTSQGSPSFRPGTVGLLQALQSLSQYQGCFFWNDDDGIGWAIRLMEMTASPKPTFCGFGMTWLGTGSVFDPVGRQKMQQQTQNQLALFKNSDAAEQREALQKQARRLWLFERGERLLWWIHKEVIRQKRSV